MRQTRRVGVAVAVAACGFLGAAGSAVAQTVQVRPDTSALILTVPSRIGLSTRDVTADDVRQNKLPGEFGAIVDQVESGGPAEKAGIRTGDVIVDFDGLRVRSSAELRRLVRETPPGRSVKVVVMRAGKRVDVAVTTADGASSRDFRFETPDGRTFDFTWPAPNPGTRRHMPYFTPRQIPDFPGRPTPGPGAVFPGPIPLAPRLGIGVQDLTPQLAEYFHTKEGVLVSSVEDGSAASRAGVKAGDIVTSIDGRAVANADEVRSAIVAKHAGDEVTLGIVRDGKPLTLKATLAGIRRGNVTPF